jgi:hypothetical protein
VSLTSLDQVPVGFHFWLIWGDSKRYVGAAVESLQRLAAQQDAEAVVGIRLVSVGDWVTAYGTALRRASESG